MPRGGARVGAGRPRKGLERARKPSVAVPVVSEGMVQDPAMEPAMESVIDEIGPKETPLEYMLAVMNCPNIDPGRRDRMAVAAAPYMHPKAGEAGKKEQKAEAAKKAVAGRFAPAAPPPALVAKAH